MADSFLQGADYLKNDCCAFKRPIKGVKKFTKAYRKKTTAKKPQKPQKLKKNPKTQKTQKKSEVK